MIVCVPVGVLAVAVTVQLTVPTGLAPCVSVQVVKPSVLAGLLAPVNDTVPAGFNAVPVLVSVTVTKNVAVPPIGAVALVGAIVVVVVRAETLMAVLTAEVRVPLVAVSV